MSEIISPSEIVSAIQSATEDVFTTMLNLPLQKGEARQETEKPPENLAGMVALVGIAGTWTGTGRISCSPQFACQLAGALLMAPYESVNEDVLDAVAEVANMIIGNVKTMFEEKVGPLGLSVPTVVFGRNYHTRTSGVLDWVVVPFESAGEMLEVRFCLMPNKAHTSFAHRAETLQTA
jgi:chemotaxis protein CheX